MTANEILKKLTKSSAPTSWLKGAVAAWRFEKGADIVAFSFAYCSKYERVIIDTRHTKPSMSFCVAKEDKGGQWYEVVKTITDFDIEQAGRIFMDETGLAI
jgi:hypothetical protein